MRIYLASRYSRIDELNDCRADLELWGYSVTSRWLNGDHRAADTELGVLGCRFALEDMEDLEKSDTVICFTEPSYSTASRGGRHVELGMALAWFKNLVIIGPRENVFCCLPQVTQYDTWEEYLAMLS